MRKYLLLAFILIHGFPPSCGLALAQTFIKGPALIEGTTSITSADGTTTLTKDSNPVQVVTGTASQTIVLPAATTLPVGRAFEFFSSTTGFVAINANGGTLLRTLAPNEKSKFRLTANGTAAGTWAIEQNGAVNIAQGYEAGFAKQSGATGCTYGENTSSGVTNFVALGSGTGCSTWTSSGALSFSGNNTVHPTLTGRGPGVYTFKLKGAMVANTGQCNWQVSDGSQVSANTLHYSTSGNIGVGSLEFRLRYAADPGTKTITIQASDDITSPSGCTVFNDAANASRALEWSVDYQPSSSQTVINPTLDVWRVDANISGANPSLGTAAVSSYTGIENGSLTLTNSSGPSTIAAQIPCSSTNAPSGTTCSAGNESVGVSFNLPKAGEVLACASFGHNIDLQVNANVNATFQLVETASSAQTILQEGKTRVSSTYVASAATGSQAVILPNRVCGTFNFTAAGQRTIRLVYEQTVAPNINFNVLLADAGASNGQRDIHWEVYPISQNTPMPVLVGGVIAKDNIGVTAINTVVAKTGTYSATINEETITQTGGNTVTLLSGVKGKKYIVRQSDNSGQVTINATSGNVCGQSSIKLAGLRDAVQLQYDGTNWEPVDRDGCEFVGRALFTCSGSSSIATQNGNWVSIGNISSGACTLTIAGFGGTPACSTSFNSASNGTLFAVGVNPASATSATTVGMGQAGGTTSFQTNWAASIVCKGPR